MFPKASTRKTCNYVSLKLRPQRVFYTKELVRGNQNSCF